MGRLKSGSPYIATKYYRSVSAKPSALLHAHNIAAKLVFCLSLQASWWESSFTCTVSMGGTDGLGCARVSTLAYWGRTLANFYYTAFSYVVAYF